MTAPFPEYYRERVNSIFNLWDPIKISKYSGAEYQAETDEILDRITKKSKPETIAKIIHRIFARNYNNEFDQSKHDCLHIAVMIKEQINTADAVNFKPEK